jgi:hypothetical protein
MQDLMCSNVERNFGTSLSLGDAIISCHVLRWGVESDYAGAPYDIVVGANVVSFPYDPVALARTFHTLSGSRTRAYVSGKARLAGPHVAFKGEMVRLFARVPRVDGPHSWLRSPGVFISCHMDGKMAARSRWVTVVATRGDTTTSQVKREGGTMRGNVQPANALRGRRDGGAIVMARVTATAMSTVKAKAMAMVTATAMVMATAMATAMVTMMSAAVMATAMMARAMARRWQQQ